jgi:LacI family transcriptional regulator, galactose operon repressor
MQAGERQATIKEVARLAGVAASSVSRVLNEHADVSPQMRARVLQAAEQLGYQPDFLAQSLRLGLTRTIGFVVRDIANPLFAGIVKGAEQELENNGYSILLMNSLGDPLLDAKHIEVLRQRRVDGLILSLQSEVNVHTRHALHSIATPIVLLDREVKAVPADAVLFDHAHGVSEAVRALAALGHRQIALIVGNSETRGSRERVKGYRAGLHEAGLPARADDIAEMSSFSRDLGYSATVHLVDRPHPPTAIIAGNSQLGIGTLAALSDRGLRPGTDMSLVICDDLELLRLMSPPISVVARDAEQMGLAAARLLLNRLRGDGDGGPQHVTLPTHYVARESSQPPPVAR